MYTGIELEHGTPAAEELISFIAATTGLRSASPTAASRSRRSRRTAASGSCGSRSTAAREHGRAQVTASHKANIMKFSDGLFLEVARGSPQDYPDIAFDDRIIDALCMQLIQAPERFDVLVMPNMYGDLVAELGAGLIGGTGVAPGGALRRPDGRELAVFEATHGTATRLAGHEPGRPGRADPVGRDAAAARRRDGGGRPRRGGGRRGARGRHLGDLRPAASRTTTVPPPARTASPTPSSRGSVPGRSVGWAGQPNARRRSAHEDHRRRQRVRRTDGRDAAAREGPRRGRPDRHHRGQAAGARARPQGSRTGRGLRAHDRRHERLRGYRRAATSS